MIRVNQGMGKGETHKEGKPQWDDR